MLRLRDRRGLGEDPHRPAGRRRRGLRAGRVGRGGPAHARPRDARSPIRSCATGSSCPSTCARSPDAPLTCHRHGHRHRRSRRGRQVHRRARRRGAARLHVPRHRGDVPRRRAGGRATAASPPPRSPQRIEIELGERVLLDGRDVTDAIRTPEVSEAASHVAADPAVREALVAKQRAIVANGDWVAEGRDIGTVVAPDAAVKVFLTADAGGARAPAREPDSARDVEDGPRRASASATSATPPPTAPRSRRRDDAIARRHHRAHARRGRSTRSSRSPSRRRRSSA